MARENATRPSVRAGRARCLRSEGESIVPDSARVAGRVQAEWERGCRWAGIALALTFGPMAALGILMGWS